MVLSFKTRVGDTPTFFVEKILKHLGSKAATEYFMHKPNWVTLMREISSETPKKLTIRDDPHFRWQPGRKIHFATGARTKNYQCFAIGECTKVADLFFHFYEDYSFSMDLDGKSLGHEEMEQLAIDDGFDTWEDFQAFHMPKGKHGAPFYPPNGWMRKRVIYF